MPSDIEIWEEYEEDEEVTPEDEAYYTVFEMVKSKYPDCEIKRGKLSDIPNNKSFLKLCYAAIKDDYYDFLVRGFMIAAIDKKTHSKCVCYRSATP